MTATVVNLLGQTVHTQSIPVANSELNATIATEALPAGVYLLHLEANGQSEVLRFVIDK